MYLLIVTSSEEYYRITNSQLYHCIQGPWLPVKFWQMQCALPKTVYTLGRAGMKL